MFKFSKLSSKSNGSRKYAILSIVDKDGSIIDDYFSVKFLTIQGGATLRYRTHPLVSLKTRSRKISWGAQRIGV